MWVLEKQVHGRLYTTWLAVGNEKDALAGPALFRLKSQGCTERYRKNVRTYLAQWAEVLYGKDLRQLRLLEGDGPRHRGQVQPGGDGWSWP